MLAAAIWMTDRQQARRLDSAHLPRGPAPRGRDREHEDPPRHSADHRRRLHPRLFLLARLHHLPIPARHGNKLRHGQGPGRGPCHRRRGLHTGVHWTFSPGAVHRPRHPLGPCGRDVRRGSVSYRRDGLRHRQGLSGGAKAASRSPRHAILACAKHFAGYSETAGRPRRVRSGPVPPQAGIVVPAAVRTRGEGGCGTFMLGYESIDGVPVTFNKWLLSDKLRGDWHYQGTLITDWDNVGPFRVGAEGQGRLRARRRGRGQGRQRPDHDHAEVLRRCDRSGTHRIA